LAHHILSPPVLVGFHRLLLLLIVHLQLGRLLLEQHLLILVRLHLAGGTGVENIASWLLLVGGLLLVLISRLLLLLLAISLEVVEVKSGLLLLLLLLSSVEVSELVHGVLLRV
jgi:hypothetical protein